MSIEINGREYRREDLDQAFELVADPTDWRAPIDKVITMPDVIYGATIKAAVEFFTATPARIKLLSINCGKPSVRIQSIGYRAGPAGP